MAFLKKFTAQLFPNLTLTLVLTLTVLLICDADCFAAIKWKLLSSELLLESHI